MITVYGIRNCDTIKKTRRWLDENKLEHNLHDYRVDGISAALVARLRKNFSPDQLINRRGTTWRNLPDTSKALADGESIGKLMVEHPAIIKRPIVTDGERWLIGFDAQAFASTFNP